MNWCRKAYSVTDFKEKGLQNVNCVSEQSALASIFEHSIEPLGSGKALRILECPSDCHLSKKYFECLQTLHPYLLIPWCRVIEKLTGLQLGKKFPAFHGPRRFITALTSVRHLSLSWTSPIQSIYPHPTSQRSILILSTHLRLGLPSGLLPSGFPTKTLYTPLFSPIRATCPAHLILLDFITRTILGEEYRLFSSSICNLLHSPVQIIQLLFKLTLFKIIVIFNLQYFFCSNRSTFLKHCDT